MEEQPNQTAGRRQPSSRARRALRNRNGSITMFVAISMTSFLGAAALATDAGSWYLAKRRVQTAADLASVAAVKVLADQGTQQAAEQMARSVLSRNGVTENSATTLQLRPNVTGSRITMEVKVQQRQPMLLAGYFLRAPAVVSAGSNTEAIAAASGACVLALTGSIDVGGSVGVNAPNCALASNYRGGDAFQAGSGNSLAGGSFRVTAFTIVTTGGCRGCSEAATDGKLTLTYPPASYQPQTLNPYAALSSFVPPRFTRACDNISNNSSAPLTPYEDSVSNGGGNKPVCYRTMMLTGGEIVRLQPGTYYIRGGDLIITSGSLTCPTCDTNRGVTIVLTGDNSNRIGSIRINGNAVLNLNGPRSSPASGNGSNVDLSGVTIFRDPNPALTSNGNDSKQVQINGGGGVTINGAIVVPASSTELSGTSGTSFGDCTVLVTGSMNMTGSAGLSADGCRTRGTSVPQPRSIRLIGG